MKCLMKCSTGEGTSVPLIDQVSDRQKELAIKVQFCVSFFKELSSDARKAPGKTTRDLQKEIM